MASDTVQINARISRPLKERGDAALERAGYSPSQAIRKLWAFAANNAHNPRAIQSIFGAEEKATQVEAEEEHAQAGGRHEEREHRRRRVQALRNLPF